MPQVFRGEGGQDGGVSGGVGVSPRGLGHRAPYWSKVLAGRLLPRLGAGSGALPAAGSLCVEVGAAASTRDRTPWAEAQKRWALVGAQVPQRAGEAGWCCQAGCGGPGARPLPLPSWWPWQRVYPWMPGLLAAVGSWGGQSGPGAELETSICHPPAPAPFPKWELNPCPGAVAQGTLGPPTCHWGSGTG